MIEIFASNQAGTAIYNLDVQSSPVEFNFSIQEMRDVSNSRSPHSYRFNMPMTDNNNKFFGEFYNVNFNSATFDAGTKTNVEVFDSGVVIMVGVLQLHSVTPSLNKYEVSVLSEVASFFDAVKDLSFEQVFITDAGLVDTDLDHTLNATNITDSWDISNDITTGNVGAGVIVYPLTDWGLGGVDPEGHGFWYEFGGYGMGIGGENAQGTRAFNFKPSINIPYLIRRVAQKAGFTIESDFLDGDIRHLYQFLATDLERTAGRPVYGSKLGLEGDYTPPIGNAMIPLTNESTAPFNDVDGLWSGGVFTAPFAGQYVFKYSLTITSAGAPDTGAFSSYVTGIKNDFTDYTDLLFFSPHLNCTYGTTQVLSANNLSMSLDAGDEVRFHFQTNNTNNAVTIEESVGTDFSFVELQQYTSTGIFVDVSANFPDIKVGEWLTEIFNRFNLVIYSTPENPTVLYIEPYNDILSAAAEKKDWSNKVDIDTLKIEPTLKYQKKRVVFEDAEGKDWSNVWWQKHFGFTKGRWIHESENDFATGEQRIGGLFQSLRLHHIPSNLQNGNTNCANVLVPRMYDLKYSSDDGLKTLAEAKPILAFYHGETDIGNQAQFRIGGNMTGYVDVSQYPFFSMYSTTPVTTDTIALDWGYDYPDNIDHPLINAGNTAGVTNMYLFRKYWARRMHEEYSSESRIMTCNAYLTPLDVNTLRWNDEIFINDTYWRVVKVSNFATGGTNPAKLELIKLISASDWNKTEGCSLYPSSYNTNGTVNFVELTTGAAASPTEECCTENGFTWDATDSVCFWKTNGNGSPNPNGGGGNPALDGTKNLSGGNTLGKIIGSVAGSSAKSFQSGGILSSTQQFNMFCQTTDANNTQAEAEGGTKSMALDINCIYLATVDVISVDVGGSAGTIGNTMTMRYQATLGNTGGTSRSVGTALINSEADAGASRSLTINQKQDAVGLVSYWELLCRGETNKDIAWLLDVKVVQLTFPDTSNISSGAVWNLTAEPLITLNLSTNQYLTWNL
mgnify:CR=1 FL=1|tara:strand:+ start:6001 stop:9039 length:3039 start_codon:yes stop_codon:yes gene_type:complete